MALRQKVQTVGEPNKGAACAIKAALPTRPPAVSLNSVTPVPPASAMPPFEQEYLTPRQFLGSSTRRHISSIRVGDWSSRDLGDIDTLVKSIERRGLINPIAVTPDGLLLLGARRLAAVQKLGWMRVPVRVLEA